MPWQPAVGTQPLSPFDHQVAGQSSMLRYDKSTVCKPLIAREHFVYKSLPLELAEFTPEYRGEIEVQLIEEDGYIQLYGLCVDDEAGDDGWPCASLSENHGHESVDVKSRITSKETTVKNRSTVRLLRSGSYEVSASTNQVFYTSDSKPDQPHTQSLNPWSLKNHKRLLDKMRKSKHSRDKIRFILLKNVVADFCHPCILDLKIGSRLHGDDASSKKVASQSEKCKWTTSSTLGVRLCGMQVYQVDANAYHSVNKYHGRTLNDVSFRRMLRDFLHNGTRFRSELIQPIVSRLSELIKCLENLHSFRFYASSLLIIYDGDAGVTAGNQDASVRESKPKLTADLASADHITENVCSSKDFIQPVNKQPSEDLHSVKEVCQQGSNKQKEHHLEEVCQVVNYQPSEDLQSSKESCPYVDVLNYQPREDLQSSKESCPVDVLNYQPSESLQSSKESRPSVDVLNYQPREDLQSSKESCPSVDVLNYQPREDLQSSKESCPSVDVLNYQPREDLQSSKESCPSVDVLNYQPSESLQSSKESCPSVDVLNYQPREDLQSSKESCPVDVLNYQPREDLQSSKESCPSVDVLNYQPSESLQSSKESCPSVDVLNYQPSEDLHSSKEARPSVDTQQSVAEHPVSSKEYSESVKTPAIDVSCDPSSVSQSVNFTRPSVNPSEQLHSVPDVYKFGVLLAELPVSSSSSTQAVGEDPSKTAIIHQHSDTTSQPLSTSLLPRTDSIKHVLDNDKHLSSPAQNSKIGDTSCLQNNHWIQQLPNLLDAGTRSVCHGVSSHDKAHPQQQTVQLDTYKQLLETDSAAKVTLPSCMSSIILTETHAPPACHTQSAAINTTEKLLSGYGVTTDDLIQIQHISVGDLAFNEKSIPKVDQPRDYVSVCVPSSRTDSPHVTSDFKQTSCEECSVSNHKLESSHSRRNNVKVDVKMIDFAHTTHQGFTQDKIKHTGPDTDYIFGLRNLLNLFQELLGLQ